MVVNIEKLLSMDEFKGMDKDVLSGKLKAVESLIRSYTNNNFQNRDMRMDAPVINGMIRGHCSYFRVGDTVQISQSKVNDGLYEITEITDTGIKVDGDLYDLPANMITKVIYPAISRKV